MPAWGRRADQNEAVGTVVRVGTEQSWSEELEDGIGEHQHHNVAREGWSHRLPMTAAQGHLRANRSEEHSQVCGGKLAHTSASSLGAQC